MWWCEEVCDFHVNYVFHPNHTKECFFFLFIVNLDEGKYCHKKIEKGNMCWMLLSSLLFVIFVIASVLFLVLPTLSLLHSFKCLCMVPCSSVVHMYNKPLWVCIIFCCCFLKLFFIQFFLSFFFLARNEKDQHLYYI